MKQKPFNPFELLNFQSNTCFLSGEKLPEGNQGFVSVFPNWLMNRYHLQDDRLAMLGGNRMKYSEMLLPASSKVIEKFSALDKQTEKAFTEGYEAVMSLPELTLFQWMARIMYGAIYQDFTYALNRNTAKGKTFSISPLMQKKIKNLHLMLQTLILPIEFDNFSPWSIQRFPVKYSKDIFNYKDETHNLNFCLGMNGFGMIACLQDNGEIGQFHKDVLDKISHQTLHPAQFEEIYGHFMYANYLLRESQDYILSEKQDSLVLHLPDNTELTNEGKPKFAKWEDKTFAQVLANLWQPWGIRMEDIYTFPNAPISYLVNEFTYEIIPADMVQLPC